MAFLERNANRGSISTAAYEIEYSMVIDGTNSDGQITQTGGDRKTHTISFWHKRAPRGNGTGAGQAEETGNDMWGTSSEGDTLRFNTSDLAFFHEGGTGSSLQTNRKFRDYAAWYHIVVAIDTTQGTAANRIKIYVNGIQETSFSAETYPDQNDEFKLMQNGQIFYIGAGHGGTTGYGSQGYYADFYIIDGAQKAATDFGEFDEDSGIWKPKKYTGAFNTGSGTNGAHYKFEGTAEGTGGSATGIDSSGNSNTMNFRNHNGGLTDTPTNNFCTINPLIDQATLAYIPSHGNTKGPNFAGYGSAVGTFAVDSGKWYWEGVTTADTGTNYWKWGVVRSDASQGYSADNLGDAMTGWYSHEDTFHQQTSSTGSSVSYNSGITDYTVDEIWSISLNCDVSPYEMTIRMNNSVAGTSANNTNRSIGTYGSNGTVSPIVRLTNNNSDDTWHNFGNPFLAALSGGNADENGYGDFAYSPPSGYYALCSKNLSEFG